MKESEQQVNSSNQSSEGGISLEIWGLGRWGGAVAFRAGEKNSGAYKVCAIDNDRQGLVCSPAEEKVFYQGKESVSGRLAGIDILIPVIELGSTMAGEMLELCREASAMEVELLIIAALPFRMDGDIKMQRGLKILAELEKEYSPVVVLRPDRYISRGRGEIAVEDIFEKTEAAGSGAVQALLGSLFATYPGPHTIRELREIIPSGYECSPGGWEGNGEGALAHGTKTAFSRMGLFSREFIRLKGLLVCISSGAELPLAEFRKLIKVIDDLVRDNSQRLVSIRKTPFAGKGWRVDLLAAFPRQEQILDAESDFPFSPAPLTQSEMDMESLDRGVFADTDPNLVGGEDLDIPTFIRKGEQLD